MMSRRACDLDAKLKVTLLELKKSNELNKALLQERDESEIEIKLMSDKYVALKNDLVKISTDFEVLHIEKEKLQEIVNKYDLCRDTYESALQKITHLERHLEEVQSQNKSLLDHRRLSSYNETMDLYTEMLNTTSDQTSALPLVTIDLTNTPSSYSPNKVPINSSKKLKKYVKLNKFIRKSENLVKSHKKCLKSIITRKQKIDLSIELNNCKEKIYNKDLEIDELSQKIKLLENSLSNLSLKYESAKNEIHEYSDQLDNLIKLGNYNMERFVSLTDRCHCNSPESDNYIQPSHHNQLNIDISSVTEPDVSCLPTRNSTKVNKCSTVHETIRRTIVYSDEFGKDLGSLLSNCLSQQVINNCFPGSGIYKIIKNIVNEKYDIHTTLVIALGNCLHMRKSDIVNLIKSLYNIVELGIGKILLCAFPYSQSLTNEQNKFIYSINNLIYSMTYHCNDIFYFESNKFVTNYYMTGGNFYLPKKQKKTIASLLAYNIYDPIISSITGLISNISNYTNNVTCVNLN